MDDQELKNRLLNVPSVDFIRTFFAEKLGISSDDEDGGKVFADLSFDGLVKHWKEKGFKKIITLAGAGISTAAGIPDFRSPDSGLYANLQDYDLPHPTSIFELEYFEENPKPFFVLAKQLYPGSFIPTATHFFVRLLHEKNLLLRHYTQNIDTLERVAGLPPEKLVEAHGTFFTNHCLGCHKSYDMGWMKRQILSGQLPMCNACDRLVKPDIVFFGENLPHTFYELSEQDFKECDLLIIMGTSLEVQPFASLVDKVGKNCVRLLINRDEVGKDSLFSFGPKLLYANPERNTRDIAFIGNCDDGVHALAKALGWGCEFKKLVKVEQERLGLELQALQSSDSLGFSSENVEQENGSSCTESIVASKETK